MASEKPKHLPLVYNPLLNCIFNNPHHSKSALKATIRELCRSHNDYAILVPPAYILQECYDHSSQKLSEICFTSEDFVKSHIIKTSAPLSTSSAPVTKVQSVLYSTMNGKQVLIKNGMVFTGRGSKRSMKLRILNVNYFISFCDYFPKSSKFLLIYIEDSLFGHKPMVEGPPATPVDEPKILPLKKESAITFEELLRNFPVLSRAMSDKFYILFHHNNRRFQRLRTRQRMSLQEIRNEFTALVDEAFSIIQNCVNAETVDGERTYNLLNSIVTQHKNVDLNSLVHEYVELNIYNKVWSQLLFQYQNYEVDDGLYEDDKPELILTPNLYRDLSCLSLNHLDIPVDEPWNLNVLYRRVSDAIEQFSQLANSTVANQKQKVLLIKNAVNILTTGSPAGGNSSPDLVVDADTLIGLLIMVVVHSKVPNLEAHLYYIRHFGASSTCKSDNTASAEIESGYLNYILSNIDAVIYHLSSSNKLESGSHLKEMISFSAQNYELWYSISMQKMDTLQRVLDHTEDNYGNTDLPTNHCIRSKNIHGESFFVFAIKAKSPGIFRMLLTRTAAWISLEDILFDVNTSTGQNLLMLALQEEVPEIVEDILDVLFANTSKRELELYLNSRDNNGRTVGHYLSHDLDAMDRVGHLIDWESKDVSGVTPLFSFCRCYDHSQYELLIKKAFECVYNQSSGPFTFENHIDKNGNTLLHVLSKGIPESQLLSRALIDINQVNDKLFFPTAIYVRFSRLDNLICLLKDSRLFFDWEDSKNFYNILDYCSFSASKAANETNQAFKSIQKVVVEEYFKHNFPLRNNIDLGVLNCRYDKSNDDWIVNVALHTKKKSDSGKSHYSTKYVTMDCLRQFVQIQKFSNPLGFDISPDEFWVNFPPGKQVIPFCSKFRANRVLEHLSTYFSSMNFVSDASKTTFLRNFSRCCQSDSTSVLDLMKEVSSRQEAERLALGKVQLSVQNIQEIEYFVAFSREDLVKFQKSIAKLNKLVSIGGVKQGDVRFVIDRFLQSLFFVQQRQLQAETEGRRLDSTYYAFQSYIQRLESGVRELLASCDKVSQKLDQWKQMYHKIVDINVELRRFEDQIVTHPSGDGDVDEHQTISRRNTLSVEDLPSQVEETSSPFFNFGFIETKNSRYKKLLYSKSQSVQELMDLNVRIKLDHEAIAAAISQFLTFRSGLMTFAIKQFTRTNLRVLRHRHYELSKTLADLHSKKASPWNFIQS
ncbi:hypothetical protein CLUG_00946 [Clavispora lusitaniae ATCC 42720]|uniref:VPS9 domain-containing protein n=1 Tax=Clavispora lusitaniae (strain ATCC 42720) TaxID=306902 RepID=C4XYC3_CLAL4|nr:uncharacterized protein CLUG_00946 [Clavispora lusitaniae ATCC 42720]EEQ36823.1 hypothetical protein CLUG_00946 [Clavispora lusitaniae ATCC 42720]